MAEERRLDKLNEFDRHNETDGNESVKKNIVLAIGFHSDYSRIVDEVHSLSLSSVCILLTGW